MANTLHLQTSQQLANDAEEQASTFSPARGAEYASSLRARLFNNDNRVMPLEHHWDFWYEKHQSPSRANSIPQSTAEADTPMGNTSAQPSITAADFAANLKIMESISDVRAFWKVWNHFDIKKLPYRDRVHLFHRAIQPTWENERNARGGCLYFKVPPALAVEFWKELCVLAIGEHLQGAVNSDRLVFRDDICGISCGNRLQFYLMQIWTRDAEHTEGIEKLKVVVREGLSEHLRPREGSTNWPYYTAHAKQKGFEGSR